MSKNKNPFVVICLRDNNVSIPIMEADEEGYPSEVMASWETVEEAKKFCGDHILCKKSRNIILNIRTGKIVFV